MKDLLRVFFCIFIASLCLVLCVDKQNQLTVLRMEIPPLVKEVKRLQEENNRLMYEVNRFECPIHLMGLIHKPEYSHLKYPYLRDIIILPEGDDLCHEQRDFAKKDG